jgi:C4-dicarboxylate-specific signal transduction histidine kinase
MNKINILVLTILALTQSGCVFGDKDKPPVVISNNEQKDKYITKVEEVVSESASALTAVVPTIPAGVPKEIVRGQIERLSGLSKPNDALIKEYERIIREKDLKAAEEDKRRAAKVDEETNKLWAQVEEKDKLLTEAIVIREEAEHNLREERKTKLILQASLACLGLLLSGVLVVAFSPIIFLKRAGAVMVASAILLEALLLWYVS